VKLPIIKTLGIAATVLSAVVLLPVAYAGVPGVVSHGSYSFAQIFAFFRLDVLVQFIATANEPTRLFLFGSALVAIAIVVRRMMIPAEADSE
jgi:hypothetical protein